MLELEDGKWYVGITTQTPEARFEQHSSGFTGAAWTKLHKPIKIFDRKFLGDLDEIDAKLYEARVTRAYMKKYGVNNVRGGDLAQTQPYVLRLGRYFLSDDWQAIWVVSLLLLVIAYLIIDKHF